LKSRIADRFVGLRRQLKRTYLEFDPRSLGLFRIVLGIVLLADLLRRSLGVSYWYTDGGLVPASLLRDADIPYLFSPFLHASTRGQALAGMALCAVVYVAFTVGFKTKWFQILAWICAVSLNNRIFFLENGGQYVLNLLCTWSLFLPLGCRFSVGAALARRRGRPVRQRPVVSLAVLGLLLQFAVIYLYNVLHKTGPAWREGSAVHYALYHERLVTVFGVWMREHVPYFALEAMSWGTLLLEGAVVVAILSPLGSRHLRLAAILVLPALHVCFSLCLHLGVFSWAMIAFYPLLLAPQHWEWIEHRLGRRGIGDLPPPTDARGRPGWPRRSLVFAREAAVVLLLVACAGDLQRNTTLWPRWLAFEQPALLDAVVRYPRIRQIWIMFAPEPSRNLAMIAVDAWTEDGRIVDPYHEVASRYPRLRTYDDKQGMPERLGQNQFFAAYSARIGKPDARFYHGGLRDWIGRYHERTGDPGNRIVLFTVYSLSGESPEPGSSVKPPIERRVLFSSR